MNDANDKDSSYVVYCHTNLIDRKKYIGVTSNSPRMRYGKDGSRYKQSVYFYNAIQKYGWKNFSHKILKSSLSKDEASEWEKYYIKLYDTQNREHGYNIQEGGISSGGMSPEGFERFISASISGNKKPIVSFDRKGKRLKEFDSITEAAEYYGVSDSGIEAALYQENKTCKKMLFRFASDVKDFFDMPEQYLVEKVYVRHYKGGKHWKTKPVVLFDENGEKRKEFDSTLECAEYLGVYHGSVSGVINGKNPTVRGYYVRRKEDVGNAASISIEGIYRKKNKKVIMLDEFGNVVQQFESLREAAKFIGGDHKALKNAAINGRVYHGKKWRLL